MSDSEQDDEFEAYLKRRTPIDKGTRSREQLEPPPELDRIVIGKARKAIQGASPLNMYHAPKWALPVALAATILISFAVLLDLGVRAKRNDASLQAARSETLAAPDSPAPLRPGSAPAPLHAPSISAAVPLPAPAPTVGEVANTTPAASAEVEFTSDRARTRLARAEKAAKRARPEPELMAGSAAPATSATRGDDATSVAPPASAPAEADSNGAKADSSAAVMWLKQIEKLRGEGQSAEAEREMKRFREKYPDYPIPKADR